MGKAVKVDGLNLSLFEWIEDVCEVCGAHVGYGFEPFHLCRCDEHADGYDEASTAETGHSDGSILIDENEGFH